MEYWCLIWLSVGSPIQNPSRLCSHFLLVVFNQRYMPYLEKTPRDRIDSAMSPLTPGSSASAQQTQAICGLCSPQHRLEIIFSPTTHLWSNSCQLFSAVKKAVCSRETRTVVCCGLIFIESSRLQVPLLTGGQTVRAARLQSHSSPVCPFLFAGDFITIHWTEELKLIWLKCVFSLLVTLYFSALGPGSFKYLAVCFYGSSFPVG